MADKRRLTVTLPDHVAAAVDDRSKLLSSTPTEYAADILRWWFGQGCPSVSAEETALRAQSNSAFAGHVHPFPKDILSLDPHAMYGTMEDREVERILKLLQMPNLFSHEKEHDEVRLFFTFDNHPTHWLQFDFFKGVKDSTKNGMQLQAFPKKLVPRDVLLRVIHRELQEMEAKTPFAFSQIPMLEQRAGIAPDKKRQTSTR